MIRTIKVSERTGETTNAPKGPAVVNCVNAGLSKGSSKCIVPLSQCAASNRRENAHEPHTGTSSRELRCWRVPWLPSGWSARFTTICAAEPSGAVGSRWPGPLASIAMLVVWRPLWQPIVALLGAESLFLAWWYRLKPSNDRDWDPSMAVLPRAVIAGDAVTIENVRNLEYRSIDDFMPQFEVRTYHLSNIKGVDVVFFDWETGSGATLPWSSTSGRRPHLHVDRGANHQGAEILGL